MDMRDIFCLKQGIDDPIKAYYQRFEAAISTSKLVKCTATTHMELKNTYLEGDNDNVTKRFQVMCLLMSENSEQ